MLFFQLLQSVFRSGTQSCSFPMRNICFIMLCTRRVKAIRKRGIAQWNKTFL